MGDDKKMDNTQTKVTVKKTSTSSIVKWVIILVCLIVLVGGAYLIFDKVSSVNKPTQVSSVLIQKKLESASDLITSKLTLKGYVNHTNNGIAFINEDSFFMTYEGTVKAGIDIKKVNVDVDDSNKTVYVTIPKSEILDVDIDDDSIKYLKENFAFFKGDQKQQGDSARKFAKKDMKKQATKTGLLKLADKQSKTLIMGLLKNTTGDYKISFKEAPTNPTTNTSSKKAK